MDPAAARQQIQQQHHIQRQHHQNNMSQTTITNDKHNDEMMQQLTILVRKTQDTDHMVQANRDIYQNFVLSLQARSKYMTEIDFAQKHPEQYPNTNVEVLQRQLASVEQSLRLHVKDLNTIRSNLVCAHREIFDRLIILQNKTLHDYLPRWHHEQQISMNGVEVETIKLDQIQGYFEKIVDIIWRIKNHIKGLQLTLTNKPNINFDIAELDKFVVCINRALENLVLNSFVVERQPPQVMKTNTRFTATVRFLCGNKLNVQLINPTVKALILSENNARTVICYHKQLIENSWAAFDNVVGPNDNGNQNNNGGQVQQPQPQQHHGVITNSANSQSSMSPTPPKPVIEHHPHQQHHHHQHHHAHHHHHQQQQQQQAQQHLSYSNLDNQAPPIMMDASPDQPMTIGDQSQVPSPTHQQFFQQNHPPHPQQQQYHQRFPMTTNMTQQFVTEIGYNPDFPINSKDFECSGEILNNSNILEYQEQTGHFISQFRNMQLKKIKRAEKKGTESVMDEKFVLLFFTEFRVADDSFWPYSINTTSGERTKRGDLLFHILAFSLPVVVTVHGNQEPHAWATVTWHNAFATPDELLYKVPDKVPWRDLGYVLSERFRSYAGRGLSNQNLRYLASKVYRNRVDNDDVLISWNQFSKEPLSDKSFTFWEWFHSILKLTKEHLKDLWERELIYGFIGKKGCVDLLLGSAYSEPTQIGTFVLRFSETALGGISIAWVASSSELSTMNPSLNDRVQILQRLSPTNSTSNVVMHLQPFLSKDLSTRSLADRIGDLKDLVYLYPNIPKNDVFEPFYTGLNGKAPTSTGAMEYIPTFLVLKMGHEIAQQHQGAVSGGAGSGGVGATCQQTDCITTTNQTQISHSSPENYITSGMEISDITEPNYPAYDPAAAVGDYNYTIQ